MTESYSNSRRTQSFHRLRRRKPCQFEIFPRISDQQVYPVGCSFSRDGKPDVRRVCKSQEDRDSSQCRKTIDLPAIPSRFRRSINLPVRHEGNCTFKKSNCFLEVPSVHHSRNHDTSLTWLSPTPPNRKVSMSKFRPIKEEDYLRPAEKIVNFPQFSRKSRARNAQKMNSH